MLRKFAVIILLFFQLVGLLYGAVNDTPTYDEPANMAASFDYVWRGDFRIYPDNPPLVKVLSGLFLLPIKDKIKFPANLETYKNEGKFDLYSFGRDFVYKKDNPTREIILLSRLPNILFTLGLAIVLYLFAKRLFGHNAGLLSLFLYALDSNIRGHGKILAYDIPLAFWTVLIMFLTYLLIVVSHSDRNPDEHWGRMEESSNLNNRYIGGRSFDCAPINRGFVQDDGRIMNIQKYKILLLFLISLFFLLAFLTKFTAIFILFIYLAGLFIYSWIRKGYCRLFTILTFLIIITVFMGIWIFGLLTGYNNPRGFDYNKLPIIASANTKLKDDLKWNLFNILPVPYYYKIGMKVMYTHDIVSQPAMLLGEVRAKNNWFFYFPISYTLKTPIPTMLIAVMALWLIAKDKLKGKKILLRRFAPFVFGLIFMLMMMIFSHINNVYRYMFPVLVLFILGCSQITEYISFRKSKKLFFSILFLVFYFLFTSVLSFPYDLSYTNELTGIPPKGYKYLSDSEIDWGQDLERLAKWLKNERLIDKEITLSYLGTADPSWYGIKFRPLHFEDLKSPKGIVLISAGNLYLGDYMWTSSVDYKLKLIQAPLDGLRSRNPDKIIGKSIFVYRFL